MDRESGPNATAASAWADCRETHLSAVFLAGDRAVKVKKPIRTEFVDLSDIATREQLCNEEVRLNRRLSNDVDLGVGHVDLDGHPRDRKSGV